MVFSAENHSMAQASAVKKTLKPMPKASSQGVLWTFGVLKHTPRRIIKTVNPLDIESVARKSLKKIDKKEQLKILSVINDIQECETIQDIPHNGKLKGTKDRYKIRVGNYRIVYKIKSQTKILITSIRNRKEVYDKFFGIVFSL